MTEQIKFQFRAEGATEWKDQVDGFGNYKEPNWFEGYHYRRKPEPEVVKPKWPESTMSEDNLYNAYESAYGCFERYRSVANASIAHALETGLVVLPETVNKPVQIDYKKDATEWDCALNAAAWEFTDNSPEKSSTLFNSCKTTLRLAILKYLEVVEKNAK